MSTIDEKLTLANENVPKVYAAGVSGGSVNIVDNLTSTSTTSALSANQGRVLNLADERIKYYGDPDIIPSPGSYFTVNSTGETITGLTDTGKTQTELVIPYKINDKEITKLESDRTSILAGATNKITKVVIPYSVTTIGNGAFDTCTALTSINIPNSVTSIGGGAFSYCNALTSIEIPNTITSIGLGAFNNCTALTSINIPNGVKSIENSAFNNCRGLTSVNIPNSVTTIGDSAFIYCSGLTSVNIPNSVRSIDAYAFGYCTSLTSIIIPNSVTSIGNGAFEGYTNLTIYCGQGSYAETYANTNDIPIKYTDIYVRPKLVKNENQDITLTCDINTIYDLGGNLGATNLNITLPNKGQYGDFIQVDFYSDSTSHTNLTINSNAGITNYDLTPQGNCIYSLYFDWGQAYANGTNPPYGWRFGYAEYPYKEV